MASVVVAALVAAIHVFRAPDERWMAGLVPRLSGSTSPDKRHGVDASGSGSSDSGSEHERGTTPRRAMIPCGSGSHSDARAIALSDFPVQRNLI